MKPYHLHRVAWSVAKCERKKTIILNSEILDKHININGLYKAASQEPCGKNYLALYLWVMGLSIKRAAYVCELHEVFSYRYGRRGMQHEERSQNIW